MRLRVYLLYFAAWTLIAVTPGPAVLSSMSQASRYGFRSSLAGVFGIQCGNALFFLFIALGLGALLANATFAFTIIRVVGAIYLLLLGVRTIMATPRGAFQEAPKRTVALRLHFRLFMERLLIQLTNPKALVFASALLPQFIEPKRPPALQLTVLVLTTIAVDSAVLSSYAFLAQYGIQSVRISGVSKWLQRIFGGALVCFSLRVMLSRK